VISRYIKGGDRFTFIFGFECGWSAAREVAMSSGWEELLGLRELPRERL